MCELFLFAVAIERPDTFEEEKLWLVRRYEVRQKRYGLEVAAIMLKHDIMETHHFR
tara:strand:+ start:187 stop:354 length:168 start_codon:yes stop_codon:yes gene_type:complete